MLRRTRSVLITTLAGLALGCAEVPRVMRYDINGADTGRTWPAPQTREVPRYRYVGQLTGEDNFRPANGETGGFRKAFNWLVGLTERSPDPLVLQRPQSGAVDEAGRVFVTDVSRKAVFVFDETNARLEIWDRATATMPFKSPIGVAIGEAGEVLVTDSELARVFRFDHEGKHLGEFGAGVLKRPTGIARDPQRGLVFVADTHAHDIKVFDPSGRLVDSIGRRGDEPGEFNFPTHLAFAQDTLYVTDMLNSRVQGFSHRGELTVKFGQRGLYVGNLVRPKGVAVDDEGNVYVVESMHDTLLVHDYQGRLLLSIGGTGQEIGRFYLPSGVWTDKQNRVFVADMFNGRVVIFQFLGGS